jgi:hypothetical protein
MGNTLTLDFGSWRGSKSTSSKLIFCLSSTEIEGVNPLMGLEGDLDGDTEECKFCLLTFVFFTRPRAV